MGKLRVIKVSPMATIQDKGRFGFRKYGIPQSGAMDLRLMNRANALVGNPENSPTIEFALTGMKFLVGESTNIAVAGSSMKINGLLHSQSSAKLSVGDELELLPPSKVYAYMALGGDLNAQNDFDSFSTYLMGGFGGYQGRSLKPDDLLETTGSGSISLHDIQQETEKNSSLIRYMKGPESSCLEEALDSISFKVDPSSNRMGIRLTGSIQSSLSEIPSSAVIPGTIQLPPDGQPIVLMNDCQTTGGYPRIGKVLDEDLGKLAQIRAGGEVSFQPV